MSTYVDDWSGNISDDRMITCTKSEDDCTALNVATRAFMSKFTKHEVAEYYNKWAWNEEGDYDSHLNAERFTSPEETAKRVRDFFPESERPKVRILDVAAGTGRVGVALYNAGFRHIDALDPSEGMMRKAKARGVYTNHIQDFIGDYHTVPVDDGYYDALASSGGIGDGHIPASAMDEMIRVVRPGGLICLTMREEFFLQQPEYQQKMDELEAAGKWRLKSKEVLDNYLVTATGYTFQLVVSEQL